MIDQDRLTIHDLRRANLCVKGLARHFDELGLDFKEFVRNGMPVEEAMKHGDEAVIRRALATREQSDGW